MEPCLNVGADRALALGEEPHDGVHPPQHQQAAGQSDVEVADLREWGASQDVSRAHGTAAKHMLCKAQHC